jgi:hypothetical protein
MEAVPVTDLPIDDHAAHCTQSTGQLRHGHLFKASPMIPGARKYLRHMSDEGARVRIITHRLFIQYFHKVAVSQTIDWLDQNGIPYWDLCFMKAKEQVGADIY